jgi:hypothetical protein
MKPSVYKCILFFASILAFTGCATHGAHKVNPTAIEAAKAEIPENQLIDVGILVFESEELTPKKAEKEGTNADIRKAESHFMPYHLKNTLHQSGHWGAIQVVPAETNSVDLLVKGKIIESNGEVLFLEIMWSKQPVKDGSKRNIALKRRSPFTRATGRVKQMHIRICTIPLRMIWPNLK